MDHQPDRSENWLEDFVLRHENRMYRTALAVLGNKADAEDIIQEAFIRVIKKQPVFQSPQHETAWLLRITVNLCKDRFRSAARRQTAPLLDSYPAPLEEQHRLMETVLSLPPKYRTVIHLFYYEGYTAAEIARITGQKSATVRSQLARARRKLKSFLKEEEL